MASTAGNKHAETTEAKTSCSKYSVWAHPCPLKNHHHREALRSLYLESLHLVERLHRRLLDVIKDEFDRNGRSDINAIQALLLFNIGSSELTAGELRSRGYYLGSNVSYNLKKLVEMEFISHERSNTDRRSVRVALTEKGTFDRKPGQRASTSAMSARLKPLAASMPMSSRSMNKALLRLDRFWNDTIAYRM